ncbi:MULTISPECIES: MFS transporter [unclassified Chelatococcus]|uniref:MFS transporter n=1 Tax=unclassified Chelatococcus TaxID=2638111 RepID=UPI001BCF755D|nr:MFS transporter [Chelatococcus sp.]MBS7740848.1 MFS transporter [Chelatococcus sp. HY11]CAH1658805.1 putative MFS family arabinose efflux permease [Hyphomicrobiales bacterium]MBX3545918.1 MFS transporter [Chelatococcus sp.]MCO5079543.1 MFS transporter [Chelatococcus sp.]CAH1684028.1 putative MFS family arabinose efflux permease [Hyphomicrobiales bacterium]
MSPSEKPAASPTGSSGFAPLRRSVFAVLWVATVLGNTGSFMRDVASAWLVTDLSASPAAVAAVQAAGMLPVFLLAIPAGVLSDILDRRRFLIAIQIMLGCVSATLMLLAQSGLMSVSLLIALTFVGGIGAALMGPTWQSIVPELVPRAELKAAVALNSLGINIARSIGPAVGGFLLAAFGAAVTYGADVASYLIVIAALLWWKRPKSAEDELGEHFAGAFRAGLRYARASRELHVVLLRALVFFAFASAVWALLPLITRELLRGDAAFYGVLLGSVGLGAIGGALVLPALRERLGVDGLMLTAAIVTGAAALALAMAPPRWLAVAILLAMGGAWIIALTTLNATAQAILPNWVRGRALAVYLTVFNGAMAGGSLTWGLIAQEIGLSATLILSAAGLIASGLLVHRVRLPKGEADLTPSHHWPEPSLAEPVADDRGPVLILIEYRIAQRDRTAFLSALERLSHARRRDGAYSWGVTEDAADPEIIVEWFMVESWAEHLRQHRRVSHADADVQGEVRRFHILDDGPTVRHLLAVHARQGQPGK